MSRPKSQVKKETMNFDKAFDVHALICENECTRRKLLAQNVVLLNEMFEKQYYKGILGFSPPPLWTGYLSMLEIYYSRAEVERWRKIYAVLVKDCDIKIDTFLDIPVSRLENIARYAKHKDDAEQMLSLARTNTPQEWQDTLLIHQGKPDHYDCPHQDKIFQICGKCGRKHLIEAGHE